MVQEHALTKRQLEIQLDKLKTLESPRLGLEQYPVSSRVASELIYMAGFERHDLQGVTIDLGTGTGRLAIGAGLMGSRKVVGVDLDEKSIALARQNGVAAGVQVEWIVSGIADIEGGYDVVVMNPPYGTRTAHLDIQFLDRAFRLAPTVYSIHKSSTREYLKQAIASKGRRIDEIRGMDLDIPHIFPFHQKKRKTVKVDLYRITL